MSGPNAWVAWSELLARFPYLPDFLEAMGLPELPPAPTFAESIASLPDDLFEDLGMTRQDLLESFEAYLTGKGRGYGEQAAPISSITIIGGRTKSGVAEPVSLELRPGEVVCIVGPTGSGKSRFLADIEWLAQGDSPTGRRVLINGVAPDPQLRYAVDRKLVAQLSQNMNFVMDLSVEEFIRMHADSRAVAEVAEVTATVLELANTLAGERFTPDTPVTALSGGQSRALMIADVACLSSSPIVLIDEIENAGIDRKRALALLTGKNKIVLMATHDPILALMGERRLVFKNGGITSIIETSAAERLSLARFELMDAELNQVRSILRSGELIGELRKGEPTMQVKFLDEAINPASVYDLFEGTASGRVGSVLLHYAVVKSQEKDGGSTAGIEYKAAGDVEEELAAIADTLAGKWQLTKVVLLRRKGRVDVGDIISLVAVSSPNSRDVFEACQFGIECLKKMRSIAKLEFYE